MTLLNLAERCEKATGPNRSLDNGIRLATNNGCAFGDDPSYTASLDAAMTLVPEGLAMGFKMAPCQRAHAMLATIGEEWDGSGATPALAICAVALRARAA